MGPLGDEVTLLLQRVRQGDQEARARLIALVYPQLKQIAKGRMRGERRDHTLQPTALVHEVFFDWLGARKWNGATALIFLLYLPS